ncbi:type IV pilus biogenesis protein PilM [Bacillus infantis]|uniref:Pilus assembly protein PilM n=1 Tax=Bacillus infantis TaxID=324767 RepID=A0A5D4RKD9_9BACI|nr:pilus assembly protein PilM [Bacillus infantis]TYS51279.1 pilus assembly protein PilM [Bacillus infantis]
MAPLISFGKNRVINITVKDHVVRMAELKNNKEPQVLRSEERYLPNGIIREGKIQDSETLTAILEECISEWKIKGKEIAFLVPDPVIIIRKLSIPQDVSAEEIKGYLYMELGTSIHLPFEDPVFDYTILETAESGTKEILLFAAPEEVVHEYVSVFEEARLKPVLADISCLALYRLYYELDLLDSEENLMMVQVDIQQVNVSIFENHKPVFMRHLLMDIDSGKWELEPGNQLTYLGDKEEIISPLEDIYKELDRVMSFYRYSLHQGNRQITRVLVDGDHPWLGKLHEELNSRLDAPVVLLADPAELGEKPSFLPQFNLNVGLGLKEV